MRVRGSVLILNDKRLVWNGAAFDYLEIEFAKNDQVFEKAIVQAKDLSEKVNPHDPSAVRRLKETIYNRTLAGVLSEIAFRYAISEVGAGKNFSFGKSQFTNAAEQIDVALITREEKRTIEVRSSGWYLTSLERVFTGAFSVIGWYVTRTKLAEKKKDFYVQMLYNFDSSTTEMQLTREVVILFAAGATRALLEEKGKDSDLKQLKATYRVINPLVAAIEPHRLIQLMLK